MHYRSRRLQPLGLGRPRPGSGDAKRVTRLARRRRTCHQLPRGTHPMSRPRRHLHRHMVLRGRAEMRQGRGGAAQYAPSCTGLQLGHAKRANRSRPAAATRLAAPRGKRAPTAPSWQKRCDRAPSLSSSSSSSPLSSLPSSSASEPPAVRCRLLPGSAAPKGRRRAAGLSKACYRVRAWLRIPGQPRHPVRPHTRHAGMDGASCTHQHAERQAWQGHA